MYQMRNCLKEKGSRFRNLKARFITAVYLLSVGIALFMWSSNLAAAVEPSEVKTAENIIATSTPIAVAYMLSVLVLKITAFVLGYLIVRLGHDTLIKGITGEIDFGFSGSGFKTKLKSASPGALFVVMGAAIIIWGLAVEKPMEIKTLPYSDRPAIEDVKQGSKTLHRTPVPD